MYINPKKNRMGRPYNAAAGPMRNAAMLAKYKPHRVVAFPGGDGTKNMIELAEREGVEVRRVQ